jgi:hypothetical protein
MTPALAGHNARGGYLWEESGGSPAFNTDSTDDSDFKPFGADATITTLEGSNNAVRVFQPGSREAERIIEQEFEGSWTSEFTLTNPWFLRGVIDYDVSTGSPYNFNGDIPYSMQIVNPLERIDKERVIGGAVVVSCDISVSAPGQVEVTLEGAYADEEVVDTSIRDQPPIENRPLHFGQATVNRDGSAQSLLQDASLSIENNTDLIYELGIRKAVDYSPKQRIVDVDYTGIMDTTDEVKRMYGASASVQSKVENTADIQFVFDNGEASGSGQNRLTVNINQALADSYSPTGLGDPEADLEEELSEMGATVDAVAETDASLR